MRIDEARALRAYTDVLAVEYDADTDLLRVVTLGDVYVVDDRDKVHVCPDREYNDVEICKHVCAALATTGRLDAPTGWLVTSSLDKRPSAEADGGREPAVADGGGPRYETRHCRNCGWTGPDSRHCPECNCKTEPAAADGGQLDAGWIVRASNGNEREADSRSEAESIKEEVESLGMSAEILSPDASDPGPHGDAGSVEVVKHVDAEPVDDLEAASDGQLPARSMEEDPLSILPGYMITEVKGTPTLNKRGISVLAYHYGVEVVDQEIVVSPQESDWEYAIVRTTVESEDGRTFLGTGTAHVDRDDEREVLLELAETRSYKRAVSFATGTGIVSYQEMVGDLE